MGLFRPPRFDHWGGSPHPDRPQYPLRFQPLIFPLNSIKMQVPLKCNINVLFYISS
jgi:hypothetical protein